MAEPITLVSGFGRCGSSLVMQMLAAGGMLVTGEYPTYEATCPAHIRGMDWWPSLAGKALKVLDPHRDPPPDWMGSAYRSIWLDRNPAEQARSQQKFVEAFVPPEMATAAHGRHGRRALMASYRADRPECLSVLRRLCSGAVTIMNFEWVLSHPHCAADTLNVAVGGCLDVQAMAAVVRKRSPRCWEGFLELDLMGDTSTTGKGA